MERIINFIMRCVLSVIAMFFINTFLAGAGIYLNVGINAATVLTSGILGIPGLVALYAVGMYRSL